MDFSGTYELQSQKNCEVLAKALGLPDEKNEKGEALKSITTIVQKGDHFKTTQTTGSNTTCNEFVIGKESEIVTVTGEKLKTIPKREGDKITMKFEKMELCFILEGDILRSTITMGDNVCEKISKKVK